MEKSESISELSAALGKAQSEFRPIKFNKINPHFKRGYADLTAIIEATRPALFANGLAVMQLPSADGAVVHVETILTHKSGQWVSGRTSLNATKADAQGMGAAITYGKRYGLSAILCVSTEEDDDGNGASEPPPAQRQAASRPEPKADAPAKRFAVLVRTWAGIKPEDKDDHRAACLEVAKFAKIDLAKATDEQFETLCAGVQKRMESGLAFADFVKEPK